MAIRISAAWLILLLSWHCGSTAIAQNAKSELDNGVQSDDQNLPISIFEMANMVDKLIDAKLEASNWSAAPLASDSSFVRRSYLDLVGHNPPPLETQNYINAGFLAPDADRDSIDRKRRRQLIAKLTTSPAFAGRLADIWGELLVPEAQQAGIGNDRGPMHKWLRERLASNLRYDRLVGDLLVVEGSDQPGALLFYTSAELKPEKLAARTARVFLGIQLDCAECHNHPFDRWTQKDFWGLAAYFAQVSNNATQNMNGAMRLTDSASGEVRLPDSDEIIPPKPLYGVTASEYSSGTRRQQLALWLASRDNPYLARAAVNRVWWILMGRGLVEPVDNIAPGNPASHPELLDALTDFFVSQQYDLRALFQAIAASDTYARATRHPQGPPPADLFAVQTAKPLSAGQLTECLRQMARELPAGGEMLNQWAMLATQLGTLRSDSGEYRAGVVQALLTLHGPSAANLTNEDSNGLLQAMKAPFLSDDQEVDLLFLSTVSRLPKNEERAKLSKYINSGNPTPADIAQSTDQKSSAESNKNMAETWKSDLLWALINSSEFAFTP